MKRFLLYILCLSFLSACERTAELSLIPAVLEQSDLEICALEECPKITINYLQVVASQNSAEKINHSIDQFIISSLFLGEDPEQMAASKEEAMKDFINAYIDVKAEFDFSAPYEAALDVDEIYQNQQLLSMDLKSYLYTGGAHGNLIVFFKNFDKKTGEQISTDALFSDPIAFTIFAEKKFRETYQIPMDGSINATGFWFEGDGFYLPDAVGFNEEGVILVYNSYEIASYADGPIDLTLSWEAVSPYLSNVYFP